jgi:antibiotic biosynthesis monooxygenase (ABM) superfamily enzyme
MHRIMNYSREFISIVVYPDKISVYKTWLLKLEETIKHYEGFLGIDIILPKNISEPEYLIIVAFKNENDLQKWNESKDLEQFRQETKDFVKFKAKPKETVGVELFFNRPNINKYYPNPAFCKKVLIGVLAVYPVILVSRYTITPLFKDLPVWLSILISTCFISPIIGWLMPKVTKLFSSWLYKN